MEEEDEVSSLWIREIEQKANEQQCEIEMQATHSRLTI
jgi:hypothetical protein